MTGAKLIIECLKAHGVTDLFGYPGGAIMPTYDAIYDSGLDHLLCRNEQGAAIAAIGYARSTGKVGVCVATSGPGATNLITGLGDAFADSVSHSWHSLAKWPLLSVPMLSKKPMF